MVRRVPEKAVDARPRTAHDAALMKRFDFRNKTVLITGASMGIGEAFARELAGRGATVILVARSEAKLETLRRELGRAQVIVADLALPGAPQRLFDAVKERGLVVDVLINNAGFGVHGAFTEVALATQREQIDLDVGALVELTHLFLPTIEERRGGVIQVGSLAGFQPVPYMAVYGASKAFVLSFSAALWAEYRPRGVRILALCPGATETAFFDRAGEVPGSSNRATPREVVLAALEAFDAGRAVVVEGRTNKVAAFLNRLLSREFTATMVARMNGKP